MQLVIRLGSPKGNFVKGGYGKVMDVKVIDV